MVRLTIKSSAIAIALFTASSAFAGPPAGVPHGPPAGIPLGPPPGVPHGPPASIPHGPPEGIPSGPPAGVTHGKPDGLAGPASSHGDPSLANGASLLRKLNAAHASQTALDHASSKSVVGALAIYKTSTQTAQADVQTYTDLVKADNATLKADQTNADALYQDWQTQLNATSPDQTKIDAAKQLYDAAAAQVTADQTKLTADQKLLDAANQAVIDAQTTLASSTNTTVTPDVVAKLNALLGI